MEAIETRQLITYDDAMRLTGLSRRTFYRRLASEMMPIYMDSRDRRRRFINRTDLTRLVKRTDDNGREYDGSAA